MGIEILRDRYGKKIGSIETKSEYKQIVRNVVGVRLGEYDIKQNFTRDKYGKKIGIGNWLSKLL